MVLSHPFSLAFFLLTLKNKYPDNGLTSTKGLCIKKQFSEIIAMYVTLPKCYLKQELSLDFICSNDIGIL